MLHECSSTEEVGLWLSLLQVASSPTSLAIDRGRRCKRYCMRCRTYYLLALFVVHTQQEYPFGPVLEPFHLLLNFGVKEEAAQIDGTERTTLLLAGGDDLRSLSSSWK